MPLIVPRIARKILPEGLRVRLRSSATVRRIAATLFSGTAHCPFPDSKFELFYDGYRNIGFGVNIAKFEWQEQSLVRELLLQKRPGVVWDIGANIGIWSLFLTSLCASDAEIRCFEPDPRNLELLRLNMTRNKIGNWTIRPLAVSNREGTATFFSDPVCGATGSLNYDRDFIGQQYGARRGEFQVQLTTVDREIAGGALPPQFLKIDVEGHELAVLEGALETLKTHRPFLIFETTRDHAEITAFFRKLDYQLLDLSGKPVDNLLFNTIAVPREAGMTR
jgi:FkbM family methyltransferase